MDRHHLAGLILAGGAGSRYGGPKAWAELPDGRTFLEACAAALRGGGAAPVVATLPPNSSELEIGGLSVHSLPEPGFDMFASIRFGLSVLAADRGWDRVGLLAVDHPLVHPETVAALAAADGPAAVPKYRDRRGHPVVIRRSVAEAIVNGGVRGPTLRDVLIRVGTTEVPVDDPGTTANCNSPDVLARALATGNRVR